MGRASIRQNRKIIPILIGMGFLAHEAVAGTWTASSQSAQNNLPIMSLETELARDADTYTDDKTLVSACTSKGQSQQTCLCVTHVLKYELTLNEYRAAVQLYDGRQTGEVLSATLKENGVTTEDLRMAQDMLEGLTETGDFSDRCNEARAYYRPNRR